MIGKQPKKMRIFVASPSDVADERAKIATVVKSLKRLADQYDVILKILDWRQVVPDMGRSQQIIFDQLKPDTWDVFIGILWHRFGTPPGSLDPQRQKEYLSGTEEEFYVAYRLWRQYGRPRIMMYRCSRAIPPDKLDPEQFKRVQEFFAQFDAIKGETPGLYQTFDSTESFEHLLHDNLMELLISYDSETRQASESKSSVPALTQPAQDNLTAWLPRYGLASNPFEVRNATQDPALPSYFIDLGYFDELLRLPDPCIIYGARGGGKTALRRMLATHCRPEKTDSPRLAVDFAHAAFQRILAPQESSTSTKIADYVETLMYYGLRALMQARNDPKVNSALNQPTHARRLASYLAHFAPRLQTDTSQPTDPLDDLTTDEILRGFGELVRAAGLATVFVLVDELDEMLVTASDTDRLIALLAPLLAELPALECPGIAFRFFIPLEIEPLLRTQQWYRPDRLRVYRIEWNEPRLVQMIGKRLAHHSRSSERVLKDLGQLCAGDLARQIDAELARLAGNQPRAALLLADLLLRTHCEQPNPPERITAQTWKIVQQKWPLIRADFVKELPLPTVVPAAGPSQSSLPPLHMENERVWV